MYDAHFMDACIKTMSKVCWVNGKQLQYTLTLMYHLEHWLLRLIASLNREPFSLYAAINCPVFLSVQDIVV